MTGSRLNNRRQREKKITEQKWKCEIRQMIFFFFAVRGLCSGVVANEARTDRQSAEWEISNGEVLLGFFGTVIYKTPKEWLRTTIPTYSVSFPLHLR